VQNVASGLFLHADAHALKFPFRFLHSSLEIPSHSFEFSNQVPLRSIQDSFILFSKLGFIEVIPK